MLAFISDVLHVYAGLGLLSTLSLIPQSVPVLATLHALALLCLFVDM